MNRVDAFISSKIDFLHDRQVLTTELNCHKQKEHIKKCYSLMKSRILKYYVKNPN